MDVRHHVFFKLLGLVLCSSALQSCGGGSGGAGSTVTAAGTNSPPVISGAPLRSVVQGSAYRFMPTATDADGDGLSYAIVNRPPWAQFDTATGELTGTPAAADVGTYQGITISVTDAKVAAGLAPFSISVQAFGTGAVTLSWTPPTQNADGSPLVDLAGYRIHWGNQSRRYTGSVALDNPGITRYVVEGLGSGQHYFAITAVNSKAVESAPSNEAAKTIP